MPITAVSLAFTKTLPTNNITRGLIRQRDALARKLRNLSSYDGACPYIDLVKNLNRRIKSRNRATLKASGKAAMANQKPKEAWRFINKAMFRL